MSGAALKLERARAREAKRLAADADQRLEEALKKEIELALGLHPLVLLTRVNAGGGRGLKGGWVKGAPAGTADYICCVGGRYLEMEVKRPNGTGRQTPKQKDRQAAVGARRGCYALVASVAQAEAVVVELLAEVGAC
jgi:hypothetical protein